MSSYTNRVLVTGATGFVGSHLCKRLVADGYQVNGLSRKGDVSKVQSIMANNNFKLIVGDLRDEKFLSCLFDGVRTVIHLAAQVPYTHDEKDFNGVNMDGTLNLLKVACNHGIKEFIYASSLSVYSSPPEYLPVDEKHPTNPIDYYGRTKLNGEDCCRAFADLTKLIILRFAGVYGVGSDKSRAIPTFVNNALLGTPIVIDGNGNNSSDFVNVKDVVQGILLAWAKGSGVYNVGSGCETTLKGLADKVVKFTGSSSRILIKNTKIERPFRFYLNINKIKQLGYKPCSLDYGLKEYINATK